MEKKRRRALCAECGSPNILVRTWAFWSDKDQEWVLEGVGGDETAICQDCRTSHGGEVTTIEWWVREEEQSYGDSRTESESRA